MEISKHNQATMICHACSNRIMFYSQLVNQKHPELKYPNLYIMEVFRFNIKKFCFAGPIETSIVFEYGWQEEQWLRMTFNCGSNNVFYNDIQSQFQQHSPLPFIYPACNMYISQLVCVCVRVQTLGGYICRDFWHYLANNIEFHRKYKDYVYGRC